MLHVWTSALHQASGSSPTVPDDWAVADLLNHSHALRGNMVQTAVLSLIRSQMHSSVRRFYSFIFLWVLLQS